MIDDIEAAVRADLESDWTSAEFIDRRANVGFSDGKTTSHTFRIQDGDQKFELVVGPQAVRLGNADGVIRTLRDRRWIELIRKERRLLVEVEDGGFDLGPRPDSIVL